MVSGGRELYLSMPYSVIEEEGYQFEKLNGQSNGEERYLQYCYDKGIYPFIIAADIVSCVRAYRCKEMIMLSVSRRPYHIKAYQCNWLRPCQDAYYLSGIYESLRQSDSCVVEITRR
jgi:hypothetical protein